MSAFSSIDLIGIGSASFRNACRIARETMWIDEEQVAFAGAQRVGIAAVALRLSRADDKVHTNPLNTLIHRFVTHTTTSICWITRQR